MMSDVMPEFMPYKLCSYSDIRACLQENLNEDLMSYVNSKMPDAYPIRQLGDDPYLPWENSGGGWNNSDNHLYAIGGAYAFTLDGNDDAAEACVANAMEIIEFFHDRIHTPQDQGHTYLLGILAAHMWARKFKMPHWEMLCEDLLNVWGPLARNRMNFYGSRNPASITSRYAIRAVDNAMIYYYWLRKNKQPEEAKAVANDVNSYLGKYLSYEFVPHRGEIIGWGKDIDGVPFHTGGFGRYSNWWSQSQNAWYLGWQEFYIQGQNIFNLIKWGGVNDTIQALLKKRLRDLDLFFWQKAYKWQTDDVNARGYGLTQPEPLFENMDNIEGVEPDKDGRLPYRLNANTNDGGGTHFYPVWWTLYYKNKDKFKRMIESTITEIRRANYGDMMLQHTILSPHFQHAVVRWKEGKYYDG